MEEDRTEEVRPKAVDLSRVVGKFGSNIISSPSSIYKLLSPFCPDNSMIRKFSGRTNNSFRVACMSNPDWHDCHARLSVDPDDSASKIVAIVEIVAALPQAHCLVVWRAEPREEIRII